MTSRQKRKHPRYRFDFPVQIHTGSQTEEPMEACTRNMSASGIYVHIPSAPAVGSRLEWEVVIASGITNGREIRLSCQGQIVRVESTDEKGTKGVAATIERYQMLPPGKPAASGE